jgi:competence protein ComEA
MGQKNKSMSRGNWLWGISISLLIVVGTIGAFFANSRYPKATPVEITYRENTRPGGSIYIGEGVALPGYYPFTYDDTIKGLIQAAGGTVNQSDLKTLKLYIPLTNEISAQKIDINRADPWLLEALPGIGATLAQRIVDYRSQNGPFSDTSGLTHVSGIGKDEYNRIKDMITVAGID